MVIKAPSNQLVKNHYLLLDLSSNSSVNVLLEVSNIIVAVNVLT